MLLVIALLWFAHGETTPQLLHARPVLDQACASYLTRAEGLLGSRSRKVGVRAYLRTTQRFLLEVRHDERLLDYRWGIVAALRQPWEARVLERLLELQLIEEARPGPWILERDAVLRALPHLARFVPPDFELLYDPFLMLRENTQGQVIGDRLYLPLQLVDVDSVRARINSAHEYLHVEMTGHPLSRFFYVTEDVAHPKDLPPIYAKAMSSEEVFAFTVDLLNLWRREKAGLRSPLKSAKREKILRAVLTFFLDTIRPMVLNDAWIGSFAVEGKYHFKQSPIAVDLEDRDVRRTLRRDLKAEVERLAEVCRDLRARLDSPGDREPLLLEFLSRHGLDPARFLL